MNGVYGLTPTKFVSQETRRAIMEMYRSSGAGNHLDPRSFEFVIDMTAHTIEFAFENPSLINQSRALAARKLIAYLADKGLTMAKFMGTNQVKCAAALLSTGMEAPKGIPALISMSTAVVGAVNPFAFYIGIGFIASVLEAWGACSPVLRQFLDTQQMKLYLKQIDWQYHQSVPLFRMQNRQRMQMIA